jgi:hypothetical protein
VLTPHSFGEPPRRKPPGRLRRALRALLPRVPLDTDLWEGGDQPSRLDRMDRRRR